MAVSPPVSTVRDLVDQGARQWAGKNAFIYPDTGCAVTYDELRRRLCGVANWLSGQGCSKGDRVAYALGNGQAAIELYLGAQYGGFVSVPLDPGDGWEKRYERLRHCEAAVFVTRAPARDLGPLREALPAMRAAALEREARLPWNAPTGTGTLAALSARDENVLDYTSGTSGAPKGVMMRHFKVLGSARIHVRAHRQTEADTGVLLLPLFHMNAQHVSVLSTLMSGGCLVVPPRFVAAEFPSLVEGYGVTWFAAVPTMLFELDRLRVDLRSPTLRFGRCSSAPLPPDLHREIEKKLGVPIIEAMGMTESGGTFFFNPLPPAVRKYGSVGVPVGYEAKVVDGNGAELPANERGMIFVRGESVMEGYYRHAARGPRDGWLSTGDVGYRDEDGFYFITGRDKDMVIRGGVNISPGEIDDVLLAHRGVAEAATVGIADRLYGENLVAFVVPKDPRSFDEKDLIEWCRERLGVSKTPARIISRDKLPRNSLGKVTRRVLKEEFIGTKSKGSGAERYAFDEVLATVTDIWERILEVKPIFPFDDFFELGGHSLAAVQILDEIEQAYGRSPPVSTFLENGSVHDFARVVLGAGATEPWKAVVPIKTYGSKPPFFGLFAEDHVLFYHDMVREMSPEQRFYGIQSPTLDNSARLPRNLEALAEICIKGMKRVQPKGPYFLGGQCTGALAALEIAIQLERRGEQVALLAIFDTSAPELRPAYADIPHYLERTIHHLAAGTLPAILRHMGSRMHKILLKKRYFNKARRGYRTGKDGKAPDGCAAAARSRRAEREPMELGVREVNRSWTFGRKTGPFPGRVLLIRSAEFAALARKDGGVERWRTLAEKLDVVVVPGGHTSIFHKPNAAHLARALQAGIDAALDQHLQARQGCGRSLAVPLGAISNQVKGRVLKPGSAEPRP